MGGPVISIDGLARLRVTMKKAEMGMGNLKDLNREAARVVEGAARPSTPVRSGRLMSSLRSSATQRAGIVRAGRKSVPYAGPIHWGRKKRNIKAQPWLVDAAKASEPAWVLNYYRGIKDILNTIEGK